MGNSTQYSVITYMGKEATKRVEIDRQIER